MNSNEKDPNLENPIDFYDIIIAIDSILSLKTGWEVKFSKRGLESYNEYKDTPSTVVGVIGNRNQGKSFILQKISDCKLISGYSVKTEGLSLLYPKNISKNIICLDTAGLDTPILETDQYKLEIGMTEDDIHEIVATVYRDKQLTELFLQKFVLKNSNILVAVVGQLTDSDQKLLNRIKREGKHKKLFIVHNLCKLTTKEQVKEYIQETLMTSLTFKLIEENFIYLSDNNESTEDKNQFYYIEEELIEKKNEDNSGFNVVHLVMAYEGSEAGNYYNSMVYQYLKKKCQTHVSKRTFDVIVKIKDHLIGMSNDLMEKPIDEANELEKGENEEIVKWIKVKESKEITLKHCWVNELGYSNFFGKSFVPKYTHYIDEEKKEFVVSFEMSGEFTNLVSSITQAGDNHIIKITGTKRCEELKSKFGLSTKESGDFIIDIRIPISALPLASTELKGKENDNEGNITLRYSLQESGTEIEQSIDF